MIFFLSLYGFVLKICRDIYSPIIIQRGRPYVNKLLLYALICGLRPKKKKNSHHLDGCCSQELTRTKNGSKLNSEQIARIDDDVTSDKNIFGSGEYRDFYRRSFVCFFHCEFPLKYIFTAYPYNLQVYGITKKLFCQYFFCEKSQICKKSVPPALKAVLLKVLWRKMSNRAVCRFLTERPHIPSRPDP